MNISISTGWLWFIIIAAIAAAIYIWSSLAVLKKQNKEYEKIKADTDLRFTQQQLAFERVENDLKLNVNTLALAQFEQFKLVELDSYKLRADAAGLEYAKVLLQRWTIEEEARIRKDAANRSVRIVMGKVAEHLIPFSEAFSQFNPKDARFIGSPIDLIVFDGLEEKNEIVTIYFLEIKTGTSALTKREQVVRDAIKQGRVEWLRISMKDFGDEVNETL